MISKARLSTALGAVVVAGGALFAASPGASASTLPTPQPPQLTSVNVVQGCPQGASWVCEPGQTGELIVNYQAAPLPAGVPSDARMETWFYANGKFISSDANFEGQGIGFPICSGDVTAYPCIPGYGATALGSAPVITAKSQIFAGNPDNNTLQESLLSGASNSLTAHLGF